MRVLAHDVPGTFEDEGTDASEDRKSLLGGSLIFGAEEADHGGLLAVTTLDGQDTGFWEQTVHTSEYLVQGSV